MIFTLVSTGQEWLNVQWDNLKKEREEGIIRQREAEEEAERVNQYTIVIYFIFK